MVCEESTTLAGVGHWLLREDHTISLPGTPEDSAWWEFVERGWEYLTGWSLSEGVRLVNVVGWLVEGGSFEVGKEERCR